MKNLKNIKKLLMFNNEKELENQLQSTLNNLDSLINNRKESIWSIDINYNYIIFNNFFKKEYYSAFNIELKKGMNALTILPPEYKEFWKSKYDSALSGESIVFEFTNSTDIDHFYEVSLNPIFTDKKVTGVTALTIDITDRKQAEMSLFESQGLLRSLFLSIQDMIYIIDINRRYTSTHNAKDSELYLPSDQFIGKSLFDVLPEDVARDTNTAIVKVLETGEFQKFEYTLLMNNKLKFFECYISPMFDKDHKITSFVAVSRDITERKHMEAEREKLQLALHEKRKMDAIGQLAGGVAHEINNVLCGIMSATQLLQLPQQNLDEKSLQYTDIILQTSTRAMDLVTKLLAFGHKGKVITTEVNMHQVLDETTEILLRTIDKKISISLTKNASKSILAGDYSEIVSIIINLGINASHAMPDGGVIQITTENIPINEFYCEISSFDIIPGEYIEIEMRDSGTGISPEDMNKIFEPFFTTKQFGTAAGLGLPSVYGAIQDHNGEITVKSEVGLGTSFKILLPCAENPVDKRDEDIQPEQGQGLILFVDDEDFNRILGREILESLGYEVLLAENGRESVDLYKQNYSEISLVVMDMIMPEMNGSEAYLKMKEINDNCKVIISSGDTKNEKIDELMTLGLKGFIHKPYRINELSKLLDEVLNH
ncbi:MAG: PAS domain-containing protein [Spirochaetaceae bacterium]|nr:PAS domain-containing protein [Spirochaetaceae bacterium]